jgi:hypothetical protein
VLTKVIRLKRYGRKRLVIVHEQDDLSDAPRFLLTDALPWESGRVIETWSYRWTSAIFHAFSKQVTGLEAAQVRKEEAVQRHFRLSCVAQSLVQRAPAAGGKTNTRMTAYAFDLPSIRQGVDIQDATVFSKPDRGLDWRPISFDTLQVGILLRSEGGQVLVRHSNTFMLGTNCATASFTPVSTFADLMPDGYLRGA